jgi:hypothetical protein
MSVGPLLAAILDITAPFFAECPMRSYEYTLYRYAYDIIPI